MMKKVLFITGTAGFLSQFELSDVRILKSMGYEIHYATNFGMPVYEVKDKTLKELEVVLHHISICKSPLKLKENVWAYRELKRIIDREKIDIVHCHNPIGGALGRLAANFSVKRPYVIYTCHGFHFFKGAPKYYWLLYYPIERVLARMTDMLITINHEDQNRAEHFTYKGNGTAQRIHSVGLDTDTFSPKGDMRAAMRGYLGIPEDAFHIVTAAEINRNKNQAVVIKAIAKLNNLNIYYTICGEGPEKENLVKLIQKEHLQNRVRCIGYRNDMSAVLQSADAFLFPSKREGMGMAALEALASGIPVVAADNRGTREYMIDGVNGYVCDADSVDEFATAIHKLINDREKAKMMGKAGILTAKKFDINTINGRMREIYTIADRRAQSISNNGRVQETEKSESGKCGIVSVAPKLQKY